MRSFVFASGDDELLWRQEPLLTRSRAAPAPGRAGHRQANMLTCASKQKKERKERKLLARAIVVTWSDSGDRLGVMFRGSRRGDAARGPGRSQCCGVRAAAGRLT